MANDEETLPEDKEKKEEEEGDDPKKPMSANERAEANIAAMKAENDRMDANLASMQEMKATEMLSGTADAGQVPAGKKEQSDTDYATQVMAGETPDGKP